METVNATPKQRATAELAELKTKVSGLANFLYKPAFYALSKLQQNLLLVQLKSMQAYETTLELRLENWEVE